MWTETLELGVNNGELGMEKWEWIVDNWELRLKIGNMGVES